MIIKEFRIIIPMTVEEYQIGQLYTIQKKSRIESVGAGSGVEIIENKPFDNGPNEKGQYTLKVYHVDERLPPSLKTVTKLLFPKSALLFEEESWNSYPYTRTKYRHKLFKSFNIDIESKYLADYGQTENTFNLTKSELASRIVDYIDIVNDPVNSNEYKSEEDPSLYEPTYNKHRGPLTPKWFTELKQKAIHAPSSQKTWYMCCYKLCRIECAFWGCQSRVEKSIADSVLRNMLLVTHRQAWTWQDEYHYLTMNDVRRLEAETQRYLMMKMNDSENTESPENFINMNIHNSNNKLEQNNTSQIIMSNNSQSNSNVLHIERLEIDTSGNNNNNNGNMKKLDSENSMKSCSSANFENQNEKLENEKENFGYNLPHRLSHPHTELEFNLQLLDDNNEGDCSQSSNNVDEFYDAISQASFNLSGSIEVKSSNFKPYKRNKLTKLSSITDSESSNEFLLDSNLKSDRYKSIRSIQSETEIGKDSKCIKNQDSQCSDSSANSSNKRPNNPSDLINSYNEINVLRKISTKESLQSKLSNRNQGTQNPIDTLILVVHGGNVTCTDTSKKSDFFNFKSTMQTVTKEHYSDLDEHIAYRLVSCEAVCKEALLKLAKCSPVAFNGSQGWENKHELAETSAESFALHENLPFNTIPLLITADFTKYQQYVAQLTRDMNRVYQDFLHSCPNFLGRVVVIGDSIGALLVYDALSNPALANNNSEDQSSTSSLSNLAGVGTSFTRQGQSQSSKNSQTTHSTSPSPVFTRKLGSEHPKINISISNLSDTFFSTANEENSNNSTIVNHSNNTSANNADSHSIGPIEGCSTPTYLTPRRSSPGTTANPSMNYEERLDFDVSHFFVFGSPLGLVLSYRKLAYQTLDAPFCTQMYNLFHLTDPGAIRVEPLLCNQFGYIPPCMIPRYSKFPMGDGYNLSLDHFIVKYGDLFDIGESNRTSESENTPNYDQLKSLHKIIQTKKNWWGDNRLDYVLYAPEKIANLPKQSLPYLFHSCFWESQDVSAFILRTLLTSNSYNFDQTSGGIGSSLAEKGNEPILEVQKWQRKFNRVKLRNLSPNHRSNDVIVNEDKEQLLSAKFSYGPLDFALSGEKIDIYIMKDNSASTGKIPITGQNEWEFLVTAVTDNHGKVVYIIPKNKRLSHGMYQIKMVVKCDHSYVEFYMAVLPANTQAVVFSIDGSFAANISFTGTDPKVRAGAVDVVRHWQDLGYLIIYVTARPDIQHYKVTNWLGQHNFPLGMVYFSNGLRHDPIKQKTETLRNLVINNSLKLQSAYGSPKDIPMYSSLGVPPNRIFIIAKALKSKYLNRATLLKDGYASHLSILKSPNADSRQASGNARLILKRTTFSIKQNPMFCNTNSNTNEQNVTLENQLSCVSTFSTVSSDSSLLTHSNPSNLQNLQPLNRAHSARSENKPILQQARSN